MEYVMVPVPEGLTEHVERFLMETDMRARAADRGTHVDGASVVGMVKVLNPQCRAVLSVLSEAALVDRPPTLTELANSIQRTEHEAMGLVLELSELVWAAFGPIMSVVPTAPSDPQAGEINWDERKVVVWRVLAEAVVAAELDLAEPA